MASGEALTDALQRLKQFPFYSFAVHLNLTEFRPFTNISTWKRNKVLNENGEFNGAIRTVKPSIEIKRAIYEEFSSQIDHLLKLHAPISHIDSHHHVHTIPWIFFILKKIQIKYGIFKVRSSLNLYDKTKEKASATLLFQKRIWNAALRYYVPTRTTDYFSPFLWFVNSPDLAPSPRSTIELMVHPDSLKKNDELDTLYSDWRNIFPYPVNLISYRDL
jgi:predicted glycoside hydrolase/deacetylase ChbG (UPF0249 family)